MATQTEDENLRNARVTATTTTIAIGLLVFLLIFVAIYIINLVFINKCI